MSRTETRRSGRTTNSDDTAFNGRATRSVPNAKDEIAPYTAPTEYSHSMHNGRKRVRKEGHSEASAVSALTESHERKRARTAGSNHPDVDNNRELETDVGIHAGSAAPEPLAAQSRPSLQKKATQKALSLADRMNVLTDRYSKLAKALLVSEAYQLELSIASIKKGSCEELNIATRPLKARHDERIRVARLRLELQRAQIDREWLAARAQAQFDFVKKRGDLRSSMRQEMSQEVFQCSHEYRDMCSENVGINLDKQLVNKIHNAKLESSGPRPATLTEKDEDFLMMDIRPAVQPGSDAMVLVTAPILDHLAAESHHEPKHSEPRKSTTKSHPKVNHASRTIFHGSSNQVAEQSGPLPGISSWLKKEKNRTKKFPPTPPPKAHHTFFMPGNPASQGSLQTSPFQTPQGSPAHTQTQFAYPGPPSSSYGQISQLSDQPFVPRMGGYSFGINNNHDVPPPYNRYSQTQSQPPSTPTHHQSTPPGSNISPHNRCDGSLPTYKNPLPLPVSFHKEYHQTLDRPPPSAPVFNHSYKSVLHPTSADIPAQSYEGEQAHSSLLHPFRRSDAGRFDAYEKNSPSSHMPAEYYNGANAEPNSRPGILWGGVRRQL